MTPFKERMNLYRAYREQNPDKNYWDWKASIYAQDNDWGYQEWKRNLPENLRYESPDYDLYGAYKAGMQPVLESDGAYHLGSRDPQTGRILKRKGHPTYQMAIDAEKAMGYDVYEGNDGYTYSQPRVPAMSTGGRNEEYVAQADAILSNDKYRQDVERELDLEKAVWLANHTDNNTGVVSPFYNSIEDTYSGGEGYEEGVPLDKLMGELVIRPEYKSKQQMERALNRAEGKRGEEYWHKGAQDATKFVGATVMAPLAATMFSVPAVVSALDVIDVIADPFNPLAYLPYYNSSVGGRFVGAVAHKFGKAYVPELLRKSSQPLALTEDGRVIISGSRTGKGHDGITNFTTDRPVVSHGSGNWDSHDLYIVNPNKVDKNSFVSIEPSDTYTLTDNPITIDRGDVTVVTGNPATIEYARKNGIPLVTNQKLQKAYQDAVNKYNFARAKEKASGSRLSFVKQEDFFDDYSRMLSQQYRKRTKPTLADYELFSKKTGLNPHIKAFDDDIAKLEYEYVTRPISAPPVTYPNGREILGSSHQFNLMGRDAYGNVFYDPATTSEGIFRKWRQNTGKTDKFEFWNKVWPEANM